MLILCSLLFLMACNNSSDKAMDVETSDNHSYDSTPVEIIAPVWDTAVPVLNPRSNKIFKNVVVERIAQDSFEISGEASVYEANVRWNLEDGHYDLGEGFATASAAGPNWGTFRFKVKAPKANENTTIHIVLFEEDMETGNKKNFLPLYLY